MKLTHEEAALVRKYGDVLIEKADELGRRLPEMPGIDRTIRQLVTSARVRLKQTH